MSARTETAPLALPRARVRGFSLNGTAAAFSRLIATALLEIRLNLLTPAPWIVGLVMSAFGYLVVRTATDASSFPLAWKLSAEIGPLSVVLLLFLAASLANRPNRYDVTELLDSKVVASEELIFGRWLGMVVAVLVPLALQYGVTMLGQKIHAKPEILPLAYLDSVLRLLPSVLFLTTFAFCLVTVTRVLVLGAGIAGLCWFALYFGEIYYPTVLRIDLSQNGPVFLGLTAATLLFMLAAYRGRRRAKRSPVTFALGIGAALAFLLACFQAVWIAMALPGKGSSLATWERIRGARRAATDPLPNFAWTDARGKRVSLAGYRGRPVLVVLFQPKDGGLAPLLGRLSGLRQEFAADGLQVLGVCLSEDLNAGAHAARLARADVPVVTEWGRLPQGAFDEKRPPSVLAWSFALTATPTALLMDEKGVEAKRGLPLDEKQWDALKRQLRAAIDGTPEAPELPEGLPSGLAGALGGMAP